MAKKVFSEVTNRLFNRMFVCKVCKSKIRADARQVRLGKVKCRKCGSRALRMKKRPGAE
jgi:ribosomal protein L40E